MINQGNNVPDNVIAIFANPDYELVNNKNKDRLKNLIDKSPKKRDWFTPHFYRCLPLTIGNQYGFVIKSEYDFDFIWNGKNEIDSVKININNKNIEKDIFSKNNKNLPIIKSHFGNGIITISVPFTLRTPPGVNLMTINPPNYIIPNITVMTGVIETDNIRRNFTFNLKIQIPNIKVIIPAGTPIAGFIPIPRYFADNFKLEIADDIFSKELIEEEYQAQIDARIFRDEVEPTLPNYVGKQYFRGEDVYGNKFNDHQKP